MTTASAILECRSIAPELARLPDDVLAELLRRCGPDWWNYLGGYKSLAAAKGVPLIEVLTAAADDDLLRIVRR